MKGNKLKYVNCPENFEPLFLQAETDLDEIFKDFKREPEQCPP